MRYARFLAALAALTLIAGCGGAGSGMMPLNSNTDTAAADRAASTSGWTVQVSRWNQKSSIWEVVLPGTGKLAIGDSIDLDLVSAQIKGRGRGGYDVLKSVTLPTGKILGNEAFGKGGYALPLAGTYKFSTTAATAGSPHASLTVVVVDNAPFDLIALDSNNKVLRVALGWGYVPYYVAKVDQKIHFAPKAKTRGGIAPGNTGLRISKIGTDLAPNYDYDMHDMKVIMVHEVGDDTVELLMGLQGGDISTLARCNIRVVK